MWRSGVDGVAPSNKNAKSVRTKPANDIYVTGADGTYTINVPAKGVGLTSRISAHRAGMTFSPAHLDLSTPSGASISGINFQGVANSTINGRVQAPGGGPLSGAKVTATAVGASAATDSASTGATGTFSLSVPAGTYDVAASKAGYTFTCPGTPANCRITVGLGQTRSFGDFKSTKDPDPPSDDATLSALSLSAGTLDPAFDAATTAYTADVATDVESTTVTATANDGNAKVEIMPADADANTDGHQVALAVGANTITATVTAEDGSTTMAYTVTVTRDAGPSDDATLRSLSLTDVTLNPAFAGDVRAYRATVGYTTGSTTVAATANSGMASVAIVPADADANTAGHQVNLRVGRTDITVRVTAEDGTEQDYTVAVTRGDAPSSDAALSDLSLSGMTLAPAFSPGGLNYTASVGNDVAQTTVTATRRHSAATVNIMPADDDPADGHQVNLAVGDTDIMVRVRAEDGTEQTYSVKVTRAQSSDASLRSLSLTDVTLDPAFDAATMAYTGSVAYEVPSTTVDAMANNGEASVNIVPADADPNTTGHQVGLAVGDNAITVIVTAQNGAREDYTVTVTRMEANSPATGQPTIDGTPRVGEMLTAITDAIADADGMANATLAYQWISVAAGVETDIAGATAMTYDVVAGDAGNMLKVMVSFTDDRGFAESATSEATEAVEMANSPATGQPMIDGRAWVGETLTANTSRIADADGMTNATLVYQWISVAAGDGAETEITGATAMTYDVVAGDAGNMLKVTVSFTDDRSFDESVTSEATEAVEMANSPATGQPTITGTAQVDMELTANTDDIMDADGMANATLAYQWISVATADDDTETETDIAGATAETYTPVAGDVGNMLKVTVSFTDDRGSAESVTSEPTDAVAAKAAAIVVKDVDGNVIDATVELTEGNDVTYTVELATMPTADVTVTIAATDGEDNEIPGLTNAGGFITLSTVTREFTPSNWNRPQAVKIEAEEDGDTDDHDGITLTHTADSDDVNYGGNASANPPVAAQTETVTVDIADDDAVGAGVTLSEAALTIAEGDADGMTYTVVLDAAPEGGGVTITIASGENDDAVNVSPSTLTFTDADGANPWNEAQTVTVTADADGDAGRW